MLRPCSWWLLTFFLQRSRTGKAIRTVAENERAAMLLGVNVSGIIAFTFFISSAWKARRPDLYGLYFDSLAPDMGRAIELKGLAVIVLGGMGTIPGAILGGLAFGLSEVLTVAMSGTSNLGTPWPSWCSSPYCCCGLPACWAVPAAGGLGRWSN